MSPNASVGALLFCTYVWFAAAASLSAEPGPVRVLCRSGEACILQCTAVQQPGVQYRALRWYKDGEPPLPRLSGILTRNLPDGPILRYVNAREDVELLEGSRDILVPNVTCADSGAYTCYLAAPVGEQNREGKVLLTLADCPNSPEEALTMDQSLVIVAVAVLMLAFVISIMSYVVVKNIFRERNKTPKKQTLLESAFKPLKEQDLKLIYTLGPKLSKTPSAKHICV